jgi:hypothetical protein
MLLVVSEYLTVHTVSCPSRLGCCLSFIFSAMMLATMYSTISECVFTWFIYLRLPFLNDLMLKPEENESGTYKVHRYIAYIVILLSICYFYCNLLVYIVCESVTTMILNTQFFHWAARLKHVRFSIFFNGKVICNSFLLLMHTGEYVT